MFKFPDSIIPVYFLREFAQAVYDAGFRYGASVRENRIFGDVEVRIFMHAPPVVPDVAREAFSGGEYIIVHTRVVVFALEYGFAAREYPDAR